MSDNKSQFGFQPENYKILLIGLAINVLGFILMIGGAATEANDFDSNELFSARRITIAPILIVLGYVVILYAIMKRKSTKE
ncbi:MAG: DUF3098 domain-containing protein [Crocinitomicaceae bacterium]|jgi:hypothetical protein|nr:DUF3098 domain-containing protein [Crocinitomicaceae bacterium]MCF8433090.1 DUF3098 domain-containing protein [Crocinitomicaceae bacterium]MDP4684952.1 DUF3098 domain-containing protein [Crocinitomicaceae bacterium]